MAWYNNLNPFREKLNPSQPDIGGEIVSSKEVKTKYQSYYESLEAVNRGVNMIVDDSGEIPYNVGEPVPTTKVALGVRKATVERVLNYEPNPFQDISTFKRAMITDYLLDGNIFLYWDGMHLFHLPAQYVKIATCAGLLAGKRLCRSLRVSRTQVLPFRNHTHQRKLFR